MQAAGSPQYDADGGLLDHVTWYPRLLPDIEAANHDLHSAVTDMGIPDLTASRDALLERRSLWPF